MKSWKAKLTLLFALALPIVAWAATGAHRGCCPFCP
jgi:hypothetical protein